MILEEAAHIWELIQVVNQSENFITGISRIGFLQPFSQQRESCRRPGITWTAQAEASMIYVLKILGKDGVELRPRDGLILVWESSVTAEIFLWVNPVLIILFPGLYLVSSFAVLTKE